MTPYIYTSYHDSAVEKDTYRRCGAKSRRCQPPDRATPDECRTSPTCKSRRPEDGARRGGEERRRERTQRAAGHRTVSAGVAGFDRSGRHAQQAGSAGLPGMTLVSIGDDGKGRRTPDPAIHETNLESLSRY